MISRRGLEIKELWVQTPKGEERDIVYHRLTQIKENLLSWASQKLDLDVLEVESNTKE